MLHLFFSRTHSSRYLEQEVCGPMDTEDLVSMHIAIRGAVAQLQTVILLLTWRTGASRNAQEQALLDHAKLLVKSARDLEQKAAPAPEETDRRMRGQRGAALFSPMDASRES
jgi:hypothetical protein